MNMVKSNTHASPFFSLLNFLGVSILASAGVSVILVGIVLLLSLAG
jgi:predicted phage tail protein